MEKEKYLPKLIQNDSWLEPFAEAIVNRLDYTAQREKELTVGTENLCELAKNHHYFGLHKTASGWIFREWAPNATQIFLKGDFSDWQVQQEYAMEGMGGIWEIELPEKALKHGDLFRLEMQWHGGSGDRLPAYASRVVQDQNTKIFNAQVWNPPTQYQWKNPDYCNPHHKPLIYEAHVGMAQEEGRVGSYDEFRRNVLPQIVKAGYNTIQLMAIQEHPYYGSFGYHVSNFFAASSRFGTPEELKQLIDQAHENNISVIMDMVHSHAVKNEIEGLSRFDGTYSLYFHEGDRGEHTAWDSRCFNYGKREVIKFLLSNCRYWLEEYKFDGFRFDGVTSMLYYDHGLERSFNDYSSYFDGGQDPEAITYLMLANKMIHELRPDAITIAEEMSGMPGLATPLHLGGYGFNFRLAMGTPDYWIKLIKEKKDEDWNVEEMFYELTRRRQDEQTIGYAESHDQALVGDKTIIFRLIDKEMYTHMHIEHQNLVVERGVALHKMIRLITLSTAGTGYLNFMGNEFGHPEWIDFPRQGNNWSFHYARRQWSLAKNPELRYYGLGLFDTDMLHIIKENQLFDDKHCYLIHKHPADQVLVYRRNDLLFVFNFNPSQSFTDYAFETEPGEFQIILNSDNKKYHGFDRIDESLTYFSTRAGNEYYLPYYLKLYIPNRTALVLKKKH